MTYPGDPGAMIHKKSRPASPVALGAADTAWIPIVSSRRWLIISRDRAIQESLSELTAVREHGAKMVCLTGDSSATKWTQLEAVMAQWPRIEKLTDRDGPFVFKATRASFNEIDIDDALDRIRRGRRRGGRTQGA